MLRLVTKLWGEPTLEFTFRDRSNSPFTMRRNMQLDPILTPMLVDEGDHYFGRRSSSTWAKKAAALRRISLARFNSKFSRSSCLRRSCSELVSPARFPWSRSACLTHLRKVSAVHPILLAIELIAAHCDSCSAWWSNTIRTARSRTSGEYFCPLLMTPILSRVGVSGNPGAVQYRNPRREPKPEKLSAWTSAS